ncbi:hypothetical protein [Bacillus cereus]|uniref:hypothetical protein n=1 Tax=Bacillus cereus TaxID=1396 RepID=UPI00366D431E
MASYPKQNLWVLDSVWERAKVRAKDIDRMPLGTVLDALLRDYAAGLIAVDVSADTGRGGGRGTKNLGINRTHWDAAVGRAEADSLSGSRLAELLLTDYAEGRIELTVTVRVLKQSQTTAT